MPSPPLYHERPRDISPQCLSMTPSSGDDWIVLKPLQVLVITPIILPLPFRQDARDASHNASASDALSKSFSEANGEKNATLSRPSSYKLGLRTMFLRVINISP